MYRAVHYHTVNFRAVNYRAVNYRAVAHRAVSAPAWPGLDRLIGYSWLTLVTTVLLASRLLAQEPARLELSPSATAPGQLDPAAGRQGDEFWQISTRALPELEDDQFLPDSLTRFPLDVQRYDRHAGWQRQTVGDLWQAAAQLPTVFYLHGNWTEPPTVGEFGARYYQLLAAGNPPPFRLIYWSWPSERYLRRIRSDIRAKAERCDTEGWQLAQVLSRWPAAAPVRFVSYSYGGRVVMSALHLHAGGDWDGRRSPLPGPTRESLFRALLIAPAMHQEWIAPGQRLGHALDEVESLTVLFNPTDRALRLYHTLFPQERPRTLGELGLSPQTLGAAANKVRFFNVSRQVGRSHHEPNYLRSGDLARELPRLLQQ
ncbi:MAG: hypothetical protein ACKOBW_10930 [Planctomycetota bacterium]